MHRTRLILQLLKLGDTIKSYISQDVQWDLGNTLSLYTVLTHGIVSHRMTDSSTINEFMSKLDKEWTQWRHFENFVLMLMRLLTG